MEKTHIAPEKAADVPASKYASHAAKSKPIAPRSDYPRPQIAAPPTVSKENVFKVPPVPFTTSSPAVSQKTVPKTASSKRAHDSTFSVAPARPPARPSAPAPASFSSTSRDIQRTPGLYPSTATTYQTVERPGKRFKPLAISRPAAQSTAPRTAQTSLATEPSIEAQSAIAHLDFPSPSDLPSLSNITLPPSLSQRKIVRRWAIILSGLSDGERRACARVSRMFRYAGTFRVHDTPSHIPFLTTKCSAPVSKRDSLARVRRHKTGASAHPVSGAYDQLVALPSRTQTREARKIAGVWVVLPCKLLWIVPSLGAPAWESG